MEQMNQLKQLVMDRIDELKQEAFALNCDLADHPELSGEEYESCEKICQLLESHGVPVERKFSGHPTAFKGIIKEDPSSPIKIGILAEYDALPGVGHACGHCASASLSILAALALLEHKDQIPGNIYIIGTPDEELIGSKIAMAEQGLFDDFSFVMMIHLANKSRVKMELLAWSAYYLHFSGKSAHSAAAPWEGRNALNGAMLMIHAIDMLRQHVKPEARIHGIITNPGDSFNIVPDQVTAKYAIRYPDKAYMNEMIRMVHDCAKGAAMATQTEVKIEETSPPLDDLKGNAAGESLIEAAFKEAGVSLCDDEDENKASSDIGNLSYRCPAFHPTLAITDESINLHTREFAAIMKEPATEKAIVQGAKIISLAILNAVFDPALLEAIKKDFEA